MLRVNSPEIDERYGKESGVRLRPVGPAKFKAGRALLEKLAGS